MTMPVIQCDRCKVVEPLTTGPSKRDPEGLTEEQRIAQLRQDGWRVSQKRDTCPRCTKIEKADKAAGRFQE